MTRVASVQAHLVLNELLKGTDIYEPMPGNTVILANTALEIITGQITPPHSAVWVTIERDPHCLVCGQPLHSQAMQANMKTSDVPGRPDGRDRDCDARERRGLIAMDENTLPENNNNVADVEANEEDNAVNAPSTPTPPAQESRTRTRCRIAWNGWVGNRLR